MSGGQARRGGGAGAKPWVLSSAHSPLRATRAGAGWAYRIRYDGAVCKGLAGAAAVMSALVLWCELTITIPAKLSPFGAVLEASNSATGTLVRVAASSAGGKEGLWFRSEPHTPTIQSPTHTQTRKCAHTHTQTCNLSLSILLFADRFPTAARRPPPAVVHERVHLPRVLPPQSAPRPVPRAVPAPVRAEGCVGSTGGASLNPPPWRTRAGKRTPTRCCSTPAT